MVISSVVGGELSSTAKQGDKVTLEPDCHKKAGAIGFFFHLVDDKRRDEPLGICVQNLFETKKRGKRRYVVKKCDVK